MTTTNDLLVWSFYFPPFAYLVVPQDKRRNPIIKMPHTVSLGTKRWQESHKVSWGPLLFIASAAGFLFCTHNWAQAQGGAGTSSLHTDGWWYEGWGTPGPGFRPQPQLLSRTLPGTKPLTWW